MSWANEYRPLSLGQLLGNTYMVEKLKRMMMLGNLPQALMFTGTQGIGKTSIARILASSLFCENLQEGERCLTCATCLKLSKTYIQEGRTVQGVPLYEYDITKVNKREDVAKIVERIQQRIMGQQKTVYILDEIQRASPEAQSCFLKVIEEPQPNVIVILCTTDEDKLITPLRSRFHKVLLRKPSVSELAVKLGEICVTKGVSYQRSALEILASNMGSVPREAINKLEFIAATTEITQQSVYQELQLPQESQYYQFFDAAFSGNLTAVIQLSHDLEQDQNLDLSVFLTGLEQFLVKLLRVRAQVDLDLIPEAQLKTLRKWSKRFTHTEYVNILQSISQIKAQTHISTEFALMQFAITVSTLLTQGNIPAVPDATLRESYAEVTAEVVTSQIQAEIRPIESASTEQFLEIFESAVNIAETEGR